MTYKEAYDILNSKAVVTFLAQEQYHQEVRDALDIALDVLRRAAVLAENK